MNTKKNKSKNKPRPVPLDPNTDQTAEINVAEFTEDVKEKSDAVIKSDEHVPEIKSEGIRLLADEKDSEFYAPKKPQRNRGKKKNIDKSDDKEYEENKGAEGIIDKTVAISEFEENQRDERSKQVTELPNITPKERIKKNKNQKHSESEDTKSAEPETVEISTKSQSKKPHTTQEILTKESLEAEIKTPKKKNKKKKRNDSEKSDKNEEVISCTAAFQKILEPRDDKKGLKRQDKFNESNKSVEQSSSDIEFKELKQNITKNVEGEKIVELCKEESKSQKKNSKKEKIPLKEDLEEGLNQILEPKNVEHTQEMQEEMKQSDAQAGIEKAYIKRKAKIAKPVEKKRKDKVEQSIEATTANQIYVSETQDKTYDLETKDSTYLVEQMSVITKIDEEPNIQTTLEKSMTELETQAVAVQDPKLEIEKKSQKFPKPPFKIDEEIKGDKLEAAVAVPSECSTFKNTTDNNVMLKRELENSEITTSAILVVERGSVQSEKESASIESAEQICIKSEPSCGTLEVEHKTELTQSEDDKKSKNKKKSPKILKKFESERKAKESLEFIKKDKSQENEDEKRTDTTDSSILMPLLEDIEIKSVKAEESEGSLQVDHKTELTQSENDKKSKTKKKSPKVVKKLESAEEKEVKNLELIKKDKSQDTKDEKRIDTTDSPTLTPLLEDVEITSVKAEESEGSVCDIVPDIQYPRASSLDNNNNIVIQDITSEFTGKLNIPVNIPDIPLITGSGETPIPTSDAATSDILITEIETKTTKPSEEKTDLKSKVMEVNKDMEDLRLSIERSLAELSAIEKSEQEKENSFEYSQIETEIKETKKEELSSVSNELKIEEIRVKELEATIPSIEEKKQNENIIPIDVPTPPVCPARKDNKGKGKSKKKGKQCIEQQTTTNISAVNTTSSDVTGSATVSSESKGTSRAKEGTSDKTADQVKGKQQCDSVIQDDTTGQKIYYEPIENFEDAISSSTDDVNKTFEIIANEDDITGAENDKVELVSHNNPKINVTAPTGDDAKPDDDDKINPVSQPKNLLGRPNIPVRSNKTDYKKEKHKAPNARQARVNIKDSVPIDKESKESQTEFKRKYLKDKCNVDDTVNCTTSENEEFIYKYSFRKVFLPSACHVCKKDLKQARVPCTLCNLVFYCSPKHKDEDYAQHQGFCFSVSTIVHLKNHKHIYADAQNITGHDYRLLRMQMIVSCEKVLKRKLTPCEQEILLYPRICADVSCREWRQTKLKDCDGCGQISFCTDHPDHFPKSHQRWCKSYALYQKLVMHQQIRGRLEPRLPTRVMTASYRIPDKINEVLASMYEGKIDMNDIQYATLTQIATAPLTAVYCQQLYSNKMNSTYANGVYKKSTYTLHVVGAELQFEADALNKWEVFFLHLKPDVAELRVVLIGHDLNPSSLPLDLLSKIRLCENCRQNKRRVIFDFQDGKTYQEYWATDFITPDLVCAFNPSIKRSSIYNGRDHWASSVKCILKLKVPFVVTSYTLIELHRDLARIKEVSEIDVSVISEPNYNSFASIRPDRNFISDDEMPLLFKNYCFMLISGVL